MVFVKIWKFKNRLEEVCGDILCSKNAILNKKCIIHFIISLELQWLQNYKYATTVHVNPKEPTIEKIGTV